MEKLLHNRKFKLLIACMSLILLLDLMQDTYAKYISSADATGNLTIAKWSFLVNEQDVLSNNDFTNTILPSFDSNANIASGVIAPTSTGYFEVEIDSSEVGVSFDQVISLAQADDNTVDDIIFTGYKKGTGNVIAFPQNTTSTSITSTQLLSDPNTVNKYRFYIEWNDNSATETMDNEDDTEAAISGTAAVSVNIQFIQRASNASSPSNPSSGD